MLPLMPGRIDDNVGPVGNFRVPASEPNSHVAPRRLRFSAFGLILIAYILFGANGTLGQGQPGILPFSTNEYGVDLATGNVNMAFPLRAKTGKIPFWSKVVGTSGMAINYTGLYYQWQPLLIYPGYKYQDPTTISFASKVVPPTVANCPYGTNSFYHAEYLGDFAVIDPTGANHPIPGSWKVGNGPAGSNCQTQQGTSGPALTYDGSGYSLVIASGNIMVSDRSGNSWAGTCTYSNGCVLGSSTGAIISDPDGTTISENDGTVTDSLATTVLSNVPYNSAMASTVSYVDVNGATQQYVLAYTPMNIATNFNCFNAAGVQDPDDTAPASLQMLTSITVPTPTPTQYTITYEPTPGKSGYFTGRIAKISLPTGGSISYSYSGGNQGINCNYGTVPKLTVTVNDGNGNTSVFTYASNISTAANTTDIPFVGVNFAVTKTDPASNQTVYSFQGEYQTSAQYYQGSATGTPLQTVVTCYNGNTSSCAAPATQISLPITQIAKYTSLGSSSSDLVQTSYDVYGNVTSETDMDYGNVGSGGSCVSATNGVCKLTTITYGSWNGSSCTPLSGVMNVPCDVKIVNNNTGAVSAETRYTYNATGHPTGVSKWVSGSTWITTNNTYNPNGTLSTTTDPNGNETQFGYTGSGGCNGMLLTSTTYPVASMGSSSQTWNCTGGVIASTVDVNKQTTAYFYADPLNRLTQVESAVGALNWATGLSAQSNTAYNYPSLAETDVAQDLTTTGDGQLTSKTIYDGLGRPIKTVARDGSVIETAYDPLNRVCAVSNPALATNAPGSLSCTIGSNRATAATDGYTYFTYDALGRKTVQTQQDSSTQKWQYNNNVVDFYDEDNSHWQWTSDSLGRLTKVLENDPAGSGVLTLETDYTYDPLNDLLTVTQKGASADTPRVRTFSYDGMSRLTYACNPESIASGVCSASGPWSAIYSYDANGNVITRTDARGIITHYAYDGMNRLTAKSYSNDPANTPALTYGYDTEYAWQLQEDEDNPVGHLNSVMATVGTMNLTTWTSADYDQRGNLTGYSNCLLSNAQSCSGYGVGTLYDYDLNEDLAGITAVAGNTFTGQYEYIDYGYDSSGRLNSIATQVSLDLTGNALTSTAFAGETYYPGGAVETANLGINPTNQVPAITLSRIYDNRGRITGETDTASTGQTAYNYSVNYDGNSNVKGYNDSVNGSWTVTDDALHRLLSMSGTLGGVATTVQETYDHFGNRNGENVSYGGYQSQPSPTLGFSAGNNRIDYASYDAAGNLTSDLTNNYLYDAENRICAVQQTVSGDMYGYVYAANGVRLVKGSLTSFSCDVTTNGISLTSAYVAGPQGEDLEEVDQNFNMLHYNVFWEGKLLGTFVGTTYDQSNWGFALNDWLGTKREVTKSDGTCLSSFFNGPFSDYQTAGCSTLDPSEEHFTSKMRDPESNLDYFSARYYNSNVGRFLSPDQAFIAWNLSNPQSFNLYSYVLNNPLSFIDPTGRDCVYFNNAGNGVESVDPDTSSQSLNQRASDCGANGGAYLNGTVNPNSVQYNSDTDTFNIRSSDALFQYNSKVTASGPNSFYGSEITNGVIDQSRTLSPQSTSGLFTYNDSLSNVLDMLKSAGVTPSSIDNRYNQTNHHGTQLRDDSTFCNLHVTITTGSGQNGAPVTGDYHYDTVNPWSFPVPVTTAAHGALDYFPDKATGLHNASSQYVCSPQ